MNDEPKLKATSLRIPMDLYQRIKAAAEADDRTATQVIIRTLNAAFPAPALKPKGRKGGLK